jgi:hypothetical protein
MPLSLFIDTNALLNFYHFSGEDLEELKKLAALIEHGEVTLWLPQQVCDEFARNRDGKIKDAMAGSTQKFSLTAPAFFRNYKEFSELRDIMKSAGAIHAKLLTAVKSDFEKKGLAADQTIKSLFDKAKMIERSPEIFAKAIERFRVGNPPGKKKATIGDEVNWESLLYAVPNGSDLHIVSVDGDYGSVLTPGTPDSFLAREYESKKAATLHLYPSLQQFFTKHFSQIKLATDISKVKAINDLAMSVAFWSTHVAISALEPFKADFTAQDIAKLVEIAETNNQVGWIIGDDDVCALYKSLLSSKEIDPALKERISSLLPTENSEGGEGADLPL